MPAKISTPILKAPRGCPPGGRNLGPDGLTDRQREYLTAIRRLHAAQGYFPTMRQVAEAVGGVRTNAAFLVMEALAAKGHLMIGPVGRGGRRFLLPNTPAPFARLNLAGTPTDDLRALRGMIDAELVHRIEEAVQP